ncbi:MAG: DUF4175 family protein [Rhodobacteraceae bacterium]|nr:DUF4175 family protein [Paracoccaceae bacterium]
MHRSTSLKRLHLVTWLSLVVERAGRAFWPVWTAAFGCYAFLAFAGGLPFIPKLAAFVFSLVLISGALVVGLIRFRWPRKSEVLQRLDDMLPDRPLTALSDRQAAGIEDQGSVAVWNEHLRRMADLAELARAPAPEFALAERDRLALRCSAAAAFLLAVIFAPLPSIEFDQAEIPGAARASSRVSGYEAWIEPPSYTRLPGIYLNDRPDEIPIEVPEQSVVTVRLDAEQGGCAVAQDVGTGGAGSGLVRIQIQDAGMLRLSGSDCEDRSWIIRPFADEAPQIQLAGPLETGLMGTLRQPLSLRDDFGIGSVTAGISLRLDTLDRRHGLEVEPEVAAGQLIPIPLPFGGPRTEFDTEFSADFSNHPWAGLPVSLEFRALDNAGRDASLNIDLEALPGRVYLDPLARAFTEQRRDLLWSQRNSVRVAAITRALTNRPAEPTPDYTAYLLSRTAARMIEDSGNVAEAADLLWWAAQRSEERDLANAREQMRRAAEMLQDAIRRGADPDEIARLSELYRHAADRFLSELRRAAEAMSERENEMAGELLSGLEARELAQADIQRMMQQLEQLLAEGRNEEAEQLLNELREALENAVAQRAPGGRTGDGIEGSLAGFSGTLQQQQGLADEAFRDLEEQRRREGVGQSEGNVGGSGGLGSGSDHFGLGSGQAQSPRADGGSLGERQEDLRRTLRRQMHGLSELGSEGRVAMNEFETAARAMTRARDHLNDSEFEAALEEQFAAMQALADGIRSLQRQSEGGEDNLYGGPPGSGETLSDPFGRRSRPGISVGAHILPEEAALRRSQEVRGEIRRRIGEPDRPASEREYLMRLLERR